MKTKPYLRDVSVGNQDLFNHEIVLPVVLISS